MIMFCQLLLFSSYRYCPFRVLTSAGPMVRPLANGYAVRIGSIDLDLAPRRLPAGERASCAVPHRVL
jgi:hypothetical protein